MSDSITDRTPADAAEAERRPFGGRVSWIRIVLIVVLLAGATVVTWRWSRPKESAAVTAAHAHGSAPVATTGEPVSLDARAARRIGVTYAPVELGALTPEIRTVAQVTYDETRVTVIAPKIEGWVEELFVNYTGQPITVGQALLTIYSPTLVSAQQELLLAGRLEASVTDASSDARQGVTELHDAARRRLRYWDISEAQIERLETTGEITKTMTLRSSVAGIITEKRVLQGQRIMAGESLYQVADLRVVWLEGEVFERDLSSVRIGAVVAADFEAYPGATRTGRITYVYPTLDPDTRTVRVRVALANGDMRLKPGMYGTIRITGRASQPTLFVPRGAVLATGERRLVFVRRSDGVLEPRAVTTGLSTDQLTQILTGVSLGDTVVSSATFLIDAESNLSSALGGMPGMDMSPPQTKSGAPPKAPPSTPKVVPPAAPHTEMPGMDHVSREG